MPVLGAILKDDTSASVKSSEYQYLSIDLPDIPPAWLSVRCLAGMSGSLSADLFFAPWKLWEDTHLKTTRETAGESVSKLLRTRILILKNDERETPSLNAVPVPFWKWIEMHKPKPQCPDASADPDDSADAHSKQREGLSDFINPGYLLSTSSTLASSFNSIPNEVRRIVSEIETQHKEGSEGMTDDKAKLLIAPLCGMLSVLADISLASLRSELSTKVDASQVRKEGFTPSASFQARTDTVCATGKTALQEHQRYCASHLFPAYDEVFKMPAVRQLLPLATEAWDGRKAELKQLMDSSVQPREAADDLESQMSAVSLGDDEAAWSAAGNPGEGRGPPTLNQLQSKLSKAIEAVADYHSHPPEWVPEPEREEANFLGIPPSIYAMGAKKGT